MVFQATYHSPRPNPTFLNLLCPASSRRNITLMDEFFHSGGLSEKERHLSLSMLKRPYLFFLGKINTCYTTLSLAMTTESPPATSVDP